jgi:hypothetical protein
MRLVGRDGGRLERSLFPPVTRGGLVVRSATDFELAQQERVAVTVLRTRAAALRAGDSFGPTGRMIDGAALFLRDVVADYP